MDETMLIWGPKMDRQNEAYLGQRMDGQNKFLILSAKEEESVLYIF